MLTYRCTVQFVSSIPKLTRIFSSEGGGGFDGFSNLSYKKNKLIYIYKGFFKIAPNLPLPSEKGNMKKYDFKNPQVFTQLEDKAIDGQLDYSDFPSPEYKYFSRLSRVG